MNTAMTTAMTASVPSAPTTPMLTSAIVGLYREGQIEHAENLVTWAWGNHYHITIPLFAEVWEATPSTAITPAPAETIKERKRRVLDDAIAGYVEAKAHDRFGKNVELWRGLAKVIEMMSDHARHKRFDRLLGSAESIQDVWDFYEQVSDALTPMIRLHWAPRAMSQNDFVAACADEAVYGQMPRMSCPACDGHEFHHNDAFQPTVKGEKLMVSFFCDGCGFPLDAVVRFTS